MILADKEKEEVKIEGKKVDILTELSILVDELRSVLSDDEIMRAVKLGMTGGDIDKMFDVLIESIKSKINKIREEKNNEDTKEDNI